MSFGKQFLLAILAACALLWLGASPARAGKIENFSAQQVVKNKQGQIQHTGMLYVTPDKVRMENPRGGDGPAMTVIVRRDLQKNWILNTQKKTYLERPLNEEEMQSAVDKMIKDRQSEDLGTEKVNGYQCHKKRVTVTTEFMGFKRRNRSVVWISDQFDFPLRTQDEEGMVTELTDIKKGRPAKGLFEIPAGYSQAANMMELMGDADEPEAGDDAAPAQGSPGGIQIPADVRKMLPKGFKNPFGD